MSKILERIGSPAPHRMLALDGGGVRGIVSIAFLEKIEALLAQRAFEQKKVANPQDFRLCQYFDVIGGTSVGSILAVLLATGWSVAEIKDLFQKWGPAIFNRPWYKLPLFSPKFNARVLQDCVRKELGDLRLGSDRFQTVVAIIAKRLDTGSPWVITNSPLSGYWVDDEEKEMIGNKDYEIAHLIRASTAAPYYFAPRRIKIDANQTGLFADGGVSPHNNPALQLFMLAGIKGYRFRWELGADKLLLISVGTGSYRQRVKRTLLNRTIPRLFAVDCLQGLIADNQNLALKLLQWMSAPRQPWEINGEVGTLENDGLFSSAGLDKPLLSFARYDLKLEEDWLETNLQKTVSGPSLDYHRAFDNPANIQVNYALASLAAGRQVDGADFPQAFDNWR